MRTALDLLAAYRSAVVAQDADALADLYAIDGVHAVPFAFPGLPERFAGREAVREGYRRLWSLSPAQPEGIDEIAVHYQAATDTVVAEQSVVGTVPATGASFGIGGVLVLVVRDGQIIEARDYLDASSLPPRQVAGSTLRP